MLSVEMRVNADCRDVIAEFACGSVLACVALRTVSHAWRRAVDTRVMGLVAVDQPHCSPRPVPTNC